jgi:choline kinase
MNNPITQVVILAAGQGTRLRLNEKDYLKPLYPLQDRALISFVMESFKAAGVSVFHVVVGYCKDELVPGIRKVLPIGTELRLIDNDEWHLSNGISLLKAKNLVQSRFFLSMSDHIFQPTMIQTLAAGAVEEDSLYLAVDRKLETIFDMDDATKVKTSNGLIQDIGKGLKDFNTVDTGLFVCPPQVFTYLESAKINGDCSLSDGVRAMIRDKKAKVVDIEDAYWQDVDTHSMLRHAENLLKTHLKS